jgi:glutamine synthetase
VTSFDERPVAEGGEGVSAKPMLASDRDGFVQAHDLWTEEQYAAAAQLRRVVDEVGIELVRFSFVDQHGTLRGKTLTREALAGALKNGTTAPSSLILKDTSGRSAYAVFSPDSGLHDLQLAGAGDLVLIPDPTTFRVLPWAADTAWILCDLHLPSGEPVQFSTRRILAEQLSRLSERGYGMTVGVELEFHVYRADDPALAVGAVGGPGAPGEAPLVSPTSPGAQLLAEEHLDAVDDIVQILRGGLLALDLPLRSIELEFGPSQLEVTLAPRPALEAADNVILTRAAIRQLCKRHGYHATFMCRPAVAGTASSGWHLHQSLTSLDSGENAFAPGDGGGVLSPLGQRYLAGLLTHATAAAVFTTPTVNGYKRYLPHSLAPDRILWGIDNKGAMIRLAGPPDAAATRLENRSGEPAANPYLYIASQLISGLDGIDRELDPGAPTDDPYAQAADKLPTSLLQAIDALRASDLFASALGQSTVDWLVTLKRAEVERYLAAVGDWEQREYFSLF